MTGIGRYILEVKVEIYLGLADVLEGLGWVGGGESSHCRPGLPANV